MTSHWRKGIVVPASAAAIRRAADILRDGGLVALPTETVYGLAADAARGRAVACIFEVKGRPSFNPLICHVTGREMASRCVEIPSVADRLIDAFWPGPLTLVLPKRPDAPVSDLVGAGLETLAVRAPAHATARQLLFALGRPLAAPSANRSGRISPTTARHVAEDLGEDVDLILDGGACAVGLESTIVGVDAGDGLTLLRPGGVTAEDIAEVAGAPVAPACEGGITAPGQMASHYAPRSGLRLNVRSPGPDDVMIGFGDVPGAFSLSPEGDLVEAAADLFATLREADALAQRRGGDIAVAPIPERGLGVAINDRLRRAAAPR